MPNQRGRVANKGLPAPASTERPSELTVTLATIAAGDDSERCKETLGSCDHSAEQGDFGRNGYCDWRRCGHCLPLRGRSGARGGACPAVGRLPAKGGGPRPRLAAKGG